MKSKQVATIILNVFLLTIAALIIFINMIYYTYNHAALAIIKGMSMYPLLHENEIVIIVPHNDINLGDVIVFKNDRNEYVIHRVIAIVVCKNGESVYVTKGDNNFYVDTHILSGVAYVTSKMCHIEKIEILQGYDMFVKQVMQNDTIRGITVDRIIGKALSISKMIIKITGIVSLSGY